MDLADLLVKRFQQESLPRMPFPPHIQKAISIENMPLHKKRGWVQHDNSILVTTGPSTEHSRAKS